MQTQPRDSVRNGMGGTVKRPRPIKVLSSWAFVVPILDVSTDDQTGDFLYIPSYHHSNCGYSVYGWDFDDQSWNCIATTDDDSEAREIAREYQATQLTKLAHFL